MKIAFSTDDGLTIKKESSCPRGFLVVVVESGNIVRQEVRWNHLSDILTSEHGTLYNLFDCDVVVLNQISSCHRAILSKQEKQVIQTDETSISSILSILQKGSEKNINSLQVA